MANGLPRQIIGSFEDIGKDIVREVAKVPTDVVGKALESLGTSSSKGQQSPVKQATSEGKKEATAFDAIGRENNQKAKQSIARAALQELASGAIKKQKEPTIWERIQMEAEQKKQQQNQQKAADSQQLQMPTVKRKRGDLYGAHAKATATENRTTRQD